jgi:hypothetical protein
MSENVLVDLPDQAERIQNLSALVDDIQQRGHGALKLNCPIIGGYFTAVRFPRKSL